MIVIVSTILILILLHVVSFCASNHNHYANIFKQLDEQWLLFYRCILIVISVQINKFLCAADHDHFKQLDHQCLWLYRIILMVILMQVDKFCVHSIRINITNILSSLITNDCDCIDDYLILLPRSGHDVQHRADGGFPAGGCNEGFQDHDEEM